MWSSRGLNPQSSVCESSKPMIHACRHFKVGQSHVFVSLYGSCMLALTAMDYLPFSNDFWNPGNTQISYTWLVDENNFTFSYFSCLWCWIIILILSLFQFTVWECIQSLCFTRFKHDYWWWENQAFHWAEWCGCPWLPVPAIPQEKTRDRCPKSCQS